MAGPTDARPIGARCWFEYHCFESHKSAHAQWWYRSQQQVTLLDYVNADEVSATQAERYDEGNQLVYRVRFDDGFTVDVFEDELLDGPAGFQRPAPPLDPEKASIADG